jgi:type I restriction enzyme S subunit
VVSSSGISSFHDKAMVSGPGVVIGRKGKLGNSYFIESDFWPHDTSLWVKDFHGNNRRYVALLLSHMRLERFDAATSVPTLNRNFVHPILVAIPKREEQDRIVKYLGIRKSQLAPEWQALAKLRKIKEGLMEDLLTGRMRVEVD